MCVFILMCFILLLYLQKKKWVKKENFIQVNCSASKNKHVHVHKRTDRYEIIFFWIWVACYVYLSNLICGWIFIVHYFIFFSPYCMYFPTEAVDTVFDFVIIIFFFGSSMLEFHCALIFLSMIFCFPHSHWCLFSSFE